MQLSCEIWSRGWTTLSSKRTLAILLSASLAVAVGYRIANRTHAVEITRTFPVLGTFATVIVTTEQEDAQMFFRKADSLLSHLDTELGRFSTTGQLYELNLTNSISAETELAELIRRSDVIVQSTGNSFDPSLGVLSEIWGFPEPVQVPDSNTIIQALACTGWSDRVNISTDSITIDQNTVLDFGAIAKGHAVDRTYELLMELGATECLVEVGGEVRCGSLTGRVWYIGVRHPRSEHLAGTLALTSGAVATSGDYECFFIEEGIRYSHLLDSETGYPSRNSASATVIAEDCATADAIATAAAVAGPEKAQTFPTGMYRGMVIVTADDNDICETYELGNVPWAE